MIKGRGVPVLLLMLVLILRPHMAGGAYPFAQGLLLIPVLVGFAILLLSPKEIEGFPKRFFHILLLPWVLSGWSLITLLWAPDPGQGLRESIALLGNLTVFSTVFLLMRKEKEIRTGSVLVLGLIVIPVLASAFYQRAFGLEKIRETLQKMDLSGEPVANLAGFISQDRVFAGFMNSNMLAGFLAITIPITLDLALGTTHRRRLFYLSIVTVLQGTVLLLTGSFGGILIALFMTGMVLVFRRGVRPREMALASVLVAFLLTGLLSIRGIDFLFGPDSSIVQRVGYIAAGMRMAWVNPLLGWGSGASPGALMGFVAEGVRPVADPHNFLVRSWISWGLPGLSLLFVFLFLWLKSVIRLFREKGVRMVPQGYAGLVFGSGAFLGHSLLDMDFFVPETALFGWCALGAALGLAAAHHEDDGATVSGAGYGLRLTMGAAALILVLPVFVFLQGESLAFRAGKAVAEREFETGTRLYEDARAMLSVNGRFALDEGRARFAVGDILLADELFHKADSLMEASPYPSWEMARLSQAQGDWKKSVPLLEKALLRYYTSPRIRIDLARAYLNLGDVGQVVHYLREARRYAIFDLQARELAEEILMRMER